MTALDSAPQHHDAPKPSLENAPAAGLSHEAQGLHQPMAPGQPKDAGSEQKSLDSGLGQGTHALYDGQPGTKHGGPSGGHEPITDHQVDAINNGLAKTDSLYGNTGHSNLNPRDGASMAGGGSGDARPAQPPLADGAPGIQHGAGPEAGVGPHHGQSSEAGAGTHGHSAMDAGVGGHHASGMGAGADAHFASGMGSGAEASFAPGSDAGAGAHHASGMGSGTDAHFASGMGSGAGAGFTPGLDAGAGAHHAPGAGTSELLAAGGGDHTTGQLAGSAHDGGHGALASRAGDGGSVPGAAGASDGGYSAPPLADAGGGHRPPTGAGDVLAGGSDSGKGNNDGSTPPSGTDGGRPNDANAAPPSSIDTGRAYDANAGQPSGITTGKGSDAGTTSDTTIASNNLSPSRDSAAGDQGITPASKYAGDHSLAAGNTDAGSDRISKDGASDRARPPELSLPTPDAIANAPIDQLQAMSRDSRQSLNDYVAAQGDNIPSVALHGTGASSGNSLANYSQNGEIWVAGPNPDRKGMGANQYVGDLSVSAQTSMGYADRRGQSAGDSPGPVHVYDASNQPEAWSKTSYANSGGGVDGSNPSDQAKFGLLDLSQAKMLGSISREQLDGMKQQFAPLNDALLAKQSDILSASGGPDQAKVNDLLARVQVMNELKRAHEARAVLDVVAQSGVQQ